MNKYQEALYRQKSNVKKLRDKQFVEYRDDFATLQELVDKATPKMVKKFVEKAGDCPNCDRIVRNYNHSYCPYCGQALKWN